MEEDDYKTLDLKTRHRRPRRYELTLERMFNPKTITAFFVDVYPRVYPCDETCDILTLDQDHFFGTDLGYEEFVLFVRGNVRGQLEFIHEMVLNKNRIGCIQGPPGQGKSTISFYASLLACQGGWRVLFIKTDDQASSFSPEILAFMGKWKIKQDLSVHELGKIIGTNVSTKTFIVLDCFNWDKPELDALADRMEQWVKENDNLRLLKIKRKFEPTQDEQVVFFNVDQWHKDELKAALKNDTFYYHVKPYLNDSIFGRYKQFRAKFRIAGSRPGYLFYKTEEVVMHHYMEWIKEWDSTGRAVLDAMIANHDPSDGKRFVSRWVSKRIALM